VPLRVDARVIGLIALAHGVSHLCQLLLPPLFPWLKEAFGVGYTELGFLMAVFFTVSCGVQATSGFVVDRRGPLPVLVVGLGLLGLAAFGMAAASSYAMLAAWVVVAGVGNGVFHPVDYTLINRKVSARRLGHAYSLHAVSGSLGWAVAPVLMVGIAVASSWRVALAVGGVVAWAVLAVIVLQRHRLVLEPDGRTSEAAGAPAGAGAGAGAAPATPAAAALRPGTAAGPGGSGTFAFLRLPSVWMCFAFFFFSACILSGVQAFAPEAARQLHGVPLGLVAVCLTTYMACSAVGGLAGGFLAVDPQRSERVVALSFGMAAVLSLSLAMLPVPALAVPVLFGAMGLSVGLAGPSRDLIIKRSTPSQASGRVYGVVYSGLDIGQAIAPLAFGPLMDAGRHRSVWLLLVALQLTLIATALNVRRAAHPDPERPA
jgi:MFS family permease